MARSKPIPLPGSKSGVKRTSLIPVYIMTRSGEVLPFEEYKKKYMEKYKEEMEKKFDNARIDRIYYYAEVKPKIYSEKPDSVEVKERLSLTLTGLPTLIRKELRKRLKICIEGDGFSKCMPVDRPYVKLEWTGKHPLSDTLNIKYVVKLYHNDKVIDKKEVSKTLTNVLKNILPEIKDIIIDIAKTTDKHIQYDVGVKLAFPPLADLGKYIWLKPSLCKNTTFAKWFKIYPKKGKAEYKFTTLAESNNPKEAIIGYVAYYPSFKNMKIKKKVPVSTKISQKTTAVKQTEKQEAKAKKTETKKQVQKKKTAQIKKPKYKVINLQYGSIKTKWIPISKPKKQKKRVALKI